MCGLTGYFSYSRQSEEGHPALKKALDNIVHRGPDHRATFCDPYISLGHCRLSIIDVTEKGNQPMSDASGDHVMIYNGVCYNHKELREQLSKSGITFKSESDTETVLHWLITHGTDGLSDINGFFSLALYDKRNKKLLLARDRFGIKPLYYHSGQDGLAFSSELKGLLPYNGRMPLDRQSLAAYLHLNYIPSPYTIFEGVSKLLPGTYLSINLTGHVEMHRFFSLEYGGKKRLKSAEENIVNSLDLSVRRRLLSDVPLGCFLSGGLDSSIVTALASRHVQKLNTYTVVFKGLGRLDESRDAALVAKKFSTNHHEVEISENDVLESLESILQGVDEPFADSSGIAVYNLCRKVRPFIKVALSGDGGDELFAGYNKHLALYYSFRFPGASKASEYVNPLVSRMPLSRHSRLSNAFRKLEKYSHSASQPPPERYWNWAGYGSNANDIMPGVDFLPSAFMSRIGPGNIANFDDCLKMDLSMVLEGDMLTKTDRMSMRNGLEVRVPFLDHELVELVSKIPARQKIGINRKKQLLKDSFAQILPASILNKRKHGFEVPLKKWLKTGLAEHRKNLLSPEFIIEQKLFDPAVMGKIANMTSTGNMSNTEYTYWNLLVFNSWWAGNNEFIER